jgi:Zn-dependent protease with chaperone function
VGHEIAHVDLRHAVERYQYQYRLGSLGGLVEMTHRVATMPFSVDQELDADAEGLRLAVAGGYNPAAAATVFARLQEEFPEPGGPQANTPAGEVAESVGGVIFSFFRTHPPSAERARRLRELSARRR